METSETRPESDAGTVTPPRPKPVKPSPEPDAAQFVASSEPESPSPSPAPSPTPSPDRSAARKEYDRLCRLMPNKPGFDAKRLWSLAYEMAGKPVPVRE